jgi:hypothetical protein
MISPLAMQRSTAAAAFGNGYKCEFSFDGLFGETLSSCILSMSPQAEE